ncbi:MAG: 50S ribosomal protein L21 [Candidatus Omnitrophica bacterium]|nr:50S ribosomal protein L21 [Candidatus Omnitrophota bacterium]MDD5573790.1 50S ribosomal protein L21 [Candidatus Omnitrophota bacterium]
MYAVIQTGGKQYKVNAGDVLAIELIDNKKDVTFQNVLMVGDGDKVSVGQPYLKGAKVTAEVLGGIRGPKSISFKYRRRKSSRRLRGHRQDLTQVRIKEITAG